MCSERKVIEFHLFTNSLDFAQLSNGFSLGLNSDAWNPEGKWQLFYPFFVSLLNQVLINY